MWGKESAGVARAKITKTQDAGMKTGGWMIWQKQGGVTLPHMCWVERTQVEAKGAGLTTQREADWGDGECEGEQRQEVKREIWHRKLIRWDVNCGNQQDLQLPASSFQKIHNKKGLRGSEQLPDSNDCINISNTHKPICVWWIFKTLLVAFHYSSSSNGCKFTWSLTCVFLCSSPPHQ